MNIAFDGKPILQQNKTGIGWLAYHVTETLLKNNAKDNLYINRFSLNSKIAIDDLQTLKALGVNENVCGWLDEKLYKLSTILIPLPYRWLFPCKTDVTVFFNYFVPPGIRGKSITYIHDMAHVVCPETTRKKSTMFLNAVLKKSCDRADAIITVSGFSKNEVVRIMGVDPQKIYVVNSGLDTSVFHPGYADAQLDAIKSKYNLPDVYFLYVGTLEPRKNIERLIEAYGKMKRKYPDAPRLVLAGQKGWMYDSIFNIVDALGLKEKVVFTGYIESNDLPVIMKGARVFVFPSLYEGFGLPPLEAMACGTPTLVSNAASLPEIVGNAAIKVNPYNIDEISESMRKLWLDDPLRAHYSELGIKRAKEFTWDVSANKLIEIIRIISAD